jgi:hypothetical protein
MPPEQDVEDLAPVSSDGAEVKDVASSAAEPAVEGESAPSSSAEGVAKEKDTSSIVRDVVDAAKKAKTVAASPAEGDETGADAGATPPKEEDNENFSDVPFGKHRRFKELLRQRNEFKVDATEYRKIQSFLDSSGMSGAEAAEGLQTLARIKTDPAGALEQARPFLQKWLAAAGAVLPEDLSQRVKAGQMTEAHALELSRTRAEAESLRARGTFDQQRRERQAETSRQQAIVSAATDWEADRRRRDPNFDAKEGQLKKEIAYLIAIEGRPNTPEGVKDQLQRAYKAAGPAPAAVVPPTQQRPAKTPVTGGSPPGSARPEPKSTLDIIRANRVAR